MTCRAAFDCEAFVLTPDAERTAPTWFCQRARQGLVDLEWKITDGSARLAGCTIKTGKGVLRADVGDYIVRYPNGHLYPFDTTSYERLFSECR